MENNQLQNAERPLVFAHIGDLHITKTNEQNYIDLLSIIAQIELNAAELDFVFLPGDIADNGKKEQYKQVSTALKMLSMPVHIIPGDHDMEQGSLDAFFTMQKSASLPTSKLIRGFRCLFLDVSGPGTGGPDFRLGDNQLNWLRAELSAATEKRERIAVFMHTYPDDLKSETEKAALLHMLATNNVILVDMGHTHYNELANDGKTIFSATRSTGQIEEGPVGYSITTIDNGIISWRFKPLADAFPFVLITCPADYRLIINEEQKNDFSFNVRAIILGAEKIKQVVCKINQNGWQQMFYAEDQGFWYADLQGHGDELFDISVKAIDIHGRPGIHTIKAAGLSYQKTAIKRDGSDKASIGAWPENGIFGTQLGPNRNAKPD